MQSSHRSNDMGGIGRNVRRYRFRCTTSSSHHSKGPSRSLIDISPVKGHDCGAECQVSLSHIYVVCLWRANIQIVFALAQLRKTVSRRSNTPDSVPDFAAAVLAPPHNVIETPSSPPHDAIQMMMAQLSLRLLLNLGRAF